MAVTKETIEKEKKKYKFGINLEKMMQSGLHLGHIVSKLNPKMANFVVGVRGNVHVIDLEKTALHLERALEFIKELTSQGKNILFIGTRSPIRNLVLESAKSVGMPYVVNRWLGGTFTNFETIHRGMKHYKELQEKKEKKELSQYTKKERVRFTKEIERLKIKFEGLENLDELPSAIFVCDVGENILAIKEARKMKIKVVAIVDTDCNPSLIDYPIPASDNSIPSVRYILKKVEEVIKKSNPEPRRAQS
ncbi:30S ribosomal protein S2 [bacterium]|nr:30S ribosomal protein S2 [bacterium]